MSVLVLGAGITGVTTAYQLAKRGHKVTVIDRASGPAAECSFQNGGQLSYSHAEPWANPGVLPKLPKWLRDPHSPLVVNLRMDPAMWMWGVKFLARCTHTKAHDTTRHMIRLALYSKRCLEELEADTAIQYSQSHKGILHIFRDAKTLEENLRHAEFQKPLGCDFTLLDSRQKCEKMDSSLKHAPSDIIGGIHFPLDSSGDAQEFTAALAKIAEEKYQVKFLYNTTIEAIQLEDGQVAGVKTNNGEMHADAYVVCLGAAAPLLLKKIKVHVPIYPMKGYSIAVPITDSKKTPTVGITDQDNKIVFSRLKGMLRIAGTAEFAGYNDSVTARRIETLKKMARETFPDAGDYDQAVEWACLRPQVPDGAPIVGQSPYGNVFMNTGHGTLGWTLANGTARIVADVLEGKEPEIDLTGLDMARF